jgi:NodT family efflux transporter outer membrane factor (OMF) lipoprotein
MFKISPLTSTLMNAIGGFEGHLRVTRAVCTILLAAVIGGCTVGPDYHAPATSMPSHWEVTPSTQASHPIQGEAPIERWWTTFDDPELDSLVSRAVQSNLDLEAAIERIRQSRATLEASKAGFLPTANLNGSYTRAGTDTSPPSDLWRTGLDAAWEIDIFGGVRRSVEASTASLQASVEDRRDVLVTLLGEVAADYIQVRGLQQEIIISHQNLDTQTHNVDLTQEKKRLGTGTELDIVQAQQQVVATTAQITSLESQEQQAIYALSILLGSSPTALDNELRAPGEIPAPIMPVTMDLPSQLLRRRPDIRRAERQLAAATATIGVATAQLFPTFSLTGSGSINAAHFGGLGDIHNALWSLGPSVSWPIYDPALWANLKLENALQQQAFTVYKQTVLTALFEVQSALVAYVKEQERRDSLANEVSLAQRAVELAKRRYQQGLTDFLAVLVAEQTLLSSQDSLVLSNEAIDTDIVTLYKALGGGWESFDAPARQP